MVYSCKKMMLVMILVFCGVCLWPAQTLTCHHCNYYEDCSLPKSCKKSETVCVLEILKLKTFLSVMKSCYTTCENFMTLHFKMEKDKAPIAPITPNKTIAEKINKGPFINSTSIEHTLLCCNSNLCNQAKTRGPGDTVLTLVLLFSFMWLGHCSVL